MPSKPDKLRRAVIKEELVAITGNFLEAVILNQMLYWSERTRDFADFVEEEQVRFRNSTQDGTNLSLQHGWIYKKAEDLINETMAGISSNSMRKYINSLVNKHFLHKRRNPTYKWDKTYQYRVDLPAIVTSIGQAGYSLQDYRSDFHLSWKDDVRTEKAPEHTADVAVRTESAGEQYHKLLTETTNRSNNNIEPQNCNVGRLGHFVSEFVQRYRGALGADYHFAAKDRKKLNSLEALLSDSEIADAAKLIPLYFSSSDSLVTSSDYSIYYFFTETVQNYLAARYHSSNEGRWTAQAERIFQQLCIDRGKEATCSGNKKPPFRK
jgi:hypothetical protein